MRAHPSHPRHAPLCWFLLLKGWSAKTHVHAKRLHPNVLLRTESNVGSYSRILTQSEVVSRVASRPRSLVSTHAQRGQRLRRLRFALSLRGPAMAQRARALALYHRILRTCRDCTFCSPPAGIDWCCLAGRRALRLRRMPLVPPAFPPPGSVFGGLCVCIMHPPLAIVAMATAVAALADGVTAIGAAVAPAATVTAVPGVAAVVAAAFASQLRAVPRLPLPRPTLPHLPRPPQPLPSPPLGSPPPLPALLVEFCRSC